MEDKKIILSEELEFFNSMKEEWLKIYEGKFALIKGKTLIDTFTTFEEAYEKSVELFGNAAVLIKKIEQTEHPEMMPALTLGLIHAHI